MATEATFTVPAGEFPLGSIFEEAPDATVELERAVPGFDVMTPYVWVRGVRVADIEAAFAAHPGVRDLRPIDVVDDQYLLRVEWATSYCGVLYALSEVGVTLLEAIGTSEEWRFRIRGDERDDVAAFYDRCRECGVSITMTGVGAVNPSESVVEAALTDAQREALVLAYRRGYFDTPRCVTMEDLGAEIGISQQAVASRLRRGIRDVLGEILSAVNCGPSEGG